MKLSNHQKDIIKRIFNGEISDIASYLHYYDLGTEVKYDENEIFQRFQSDSIPKVYYWNKELNRNKANTLSENEYKRKEMLKELHPEYYNSSSLKLTLSLKKKQIEWNGEVYSFNFYSGVYVAKSIDPIIDFLALCQYLKAEMLILEVPCTPTKDSLGLFFEKDGNAPEESTESTEPPIHYETLTIDDSYYLKEQQYVFSDKNCTICSDYIGKKIYPSSKLKLFISHSFKTSSERSQTAALRAAWIAIIISLATSVISAVRDRTDKQLSTLITETESIKTYIEAMSNEPRPGDDFAYVIEETETVISILEQINEKILDRPIQSSGKED